VKIGRVKSRPDRRTIGLGSVVAAAGVMPGVPSARRWSLVGSSPPYRPIVWGEFLNLQIGSCTAASIAHWCQLVAAHTGTVPQLTDSDVQAAYSAVGGYDPARPDATDNGASMLMMLRYFRHTGLIDAYASVDFRNPTLVELAIDLFGGVYVGLDLPIAWQSAEVWDAAPASTRVRAPWSRNSWGGHAVWISDYDQVGYWLPTWGKLKRLTRAGLIAYGDECYLASSKRWKESPAGAPCGYLAGALEGFVSRVAS